MTFLTRTRLSAPNLSARLGVTVSLPLLDAMIPALRAGIQPASGLGFVYLPHGAVMDGWTPSSGKFMGQ